MTLLHTANAVILFSILSVPHKNIMVRQILFLYENYENCLFSFIGYIGKCILVVLNDIS